MPVRRTGRPITVGPKRTKADALAAAELRAGKSDRIIPIVAFAALTGYDRGTVSRWIDRGCPVEAKGAKVDFTQSASGVYNVAPHTGA